MERSKNGSLNGRASTVVVEKPLPETELLTSDKVEVAPPSEAPAVHQESEVESAQPLTPEPTPKKKNRKPLIFAIAGIGAIVAGKLGLKQGEEQDPHQQ